jgi:glycosyltransferase involved in cell wall biosynthesis
MALNAAGVSGVPRYTAVLANALAEVSDEFPELELDLVTTPAGAASIDTTRLRVRLVRPLGVEPKRGSIRLLAEQVAVLLTRSDLVHFFDVYGPALAPWRPFSATFHDAAICYPNLAHFGLAQRLYKQRLYPWALKRASAAVAVSQFAKEEAVEQFGADPAKITVVHSGPGLSPRVDAQNGSDGGAPYFLFVGNLTMSKNLPFLIRAYERADVEADLVLAGRPLADAGSIVEAIQLSPKRDRIRIVERPDDAAVDALYRHALALLHPSRYEGFGFTPLEAMSRGCPVLASDIPALREVSGAGSMLAPLQEEAWIDGIRRIAKENQLRQDLRKRGLDTVAGYSWQETARGLCRLFAQVSLKRRKA